MLDGEGGVQPPPSSANASQVNHVSSQERSGLCEVESDGTLVVMHRYIWPLIRKVQGYGAAPAAVQKQFRWLSGTVETM